MTFITGRSEEGADRDASLLRRGDVRVWYRLTGALDDAEAGALIDRLPEVERERCRALRFARDRRDFAAAHSLLRETLSRYGNAVPGEWQFETNAYGKPSLVPGHGSDLTCNLSHTHGLVACAIARTNALGVDVEAMDRRASGQDIVASYFSPVEIEALAAGDPETYQERFLEVWTLKEAYIKALGLGLSQALDSFSFVLAGEGGIAFTPPPDAEPAQFRFSLASPAPGFRLALACDGPVTQATLHDASAGDAAGVAMQLSG